MPYIPLYRKWRSQNFDEIVGQEFIVQTLKNAIKSSRVSHAYLFSGPRGTGKTSTARIFAKALNCVKGPTPDPCGVCDRCVKIKDGHAVDVTEIDAASNRGIDEIRDLREKVRYAPVEGKFKVYIIDEVHMLTSEAFNALLKTLEEPPSHVIFVLATTEPQKVPMTIASRCQRLDFRRLSNQEMAVQIKKIADAEGVKMDDDAATLIARNSEGSMRDAISLFDQLISFSGKSIRRDDVVSVLGTANTDIVFDFGDALGRNDTAKLFDLINTMASSGMSIPQATREILLHLRNLMFTLLGSEALVEESTEHMAKLKEQSKLFTLNRMKDMISIISRAEVDMKWHPQARILLEVAVMECCGERALPAEGNMIEVKKTEKKIEFRAEKPSIAEKPSPVIDRGAAQVMQEKSAVVFGGDGISAMKMKWDAILNDVKKKNIFAYISLHEGSPSRLDDGKLTIKFKQGFAFHKERLEDGPARAAVEEAIKNVYGKDIKIDCIIESVSPAPEGMATKAVELFSGQVIS